MPFKKYFQIASVLLLVFSSFINVKAQQKPIEINVKNPSLLKVDNTGNIYIVSNEKTLLRYDMSGNENGRYDYIQYGKIAWIDVSNPLKILVFYPDFSRIILLDNQLSIKSNIQLNDIGFYSVSASGIADDGGIWLYDISLAQLIKLDYQLKVSEKSNDIRIESGIVPTPSSLVVSKEFVFLVDSLNGIFIFDRYANFINTLSIYDAPKINVINKQIIWQNKDSLFNFNLNNHQMKSTSISPKALDVTIYRDKVLTLFPDRINISYRIDE